MTLKHNIDAKAPADCPSKVVSDAEANPKTLKFEQSGCSGRPDRLLSVTAQR